MFRTTSSLDFSDCPEPTQEAIEFLRPKMSPWAMRRFGGSRDGAYLLPDCLDTIAACFSPGVRNSKTFEDDLLERTGMRTHLMDFTSSPEELSTSLSPGLQTFEKKWLSPYSSSDNMSLEDWIARHEPDDKMDLLLQMDIEGAEWEILSTVNPSTIRRFKVIVIELHKLDDLMSSSEAFVSRASQAFALLKENFTVIHAHPNNCCGSSPNLFGSGFKVPRTLELTLVRTDVLQKGLAQAPGIVPELPHALDIRRNVPGKPPIFLGRGWRSSPMRPRVVLRIVLQTFNYEVFWRGKKLVPVKAYLWLKRFFRANFANRRASETFPAS